MANTFIRTYTYAGQESDLSGNREIQLSDFDVSGDKNPITQILRIDVSWYRKHGTSSIVTHTAELEFADDAGTVLKSNSVAKRHKGGIFKIDASFADMPDAKLWDESKIKLHLNVDTKFDTVYWFATSSQPTVLTITYTSSEFKPSISEAKIYRAGEIGDADDSGEKVGFTAKLAVEKPGASGGGVFKIYSGDSAYDTAEERYSRNVESDELPLTLYAALLPKVTVDSGVKKWFRMEFAYTATTDSGIVSEEIVSVTFLITNVFTNVHLAGTKNGGVALGKYSASTDDNPMFECKYPAYFLGGIALADGGVEERALAFDADAPFIVRADNPFQPTLRRFGHVIELHGEIQPAQSIAGSTTYWPICTLPEACAPHHDIVALQQGSNQSIWMLRIFRRDHADYPCKVMFARYRSGDAWAEAATTAWLPFHVTWIV